MIHIKLHITFYSKYFTLQYFLVMQKKPFKQRLKKYIHKITRTKLAELGKTKLGKTSLHENNLNQTV